MKDEILIKYFLGEATVEEIDFIENWLHKDGRNQQYYLQLQRIWKKSESLKLEPDHIYDTDAEWERLRKKMQRNSQTTRDGQAKLTTEIAPNEPVHAEKSKVLPLKIWKWAAAIVILGMGGWFALHSIQSSKTKNRQLVLTAAASPVTDTLSDGSIITLNRYSSLLAPSKFSGKTREVTLQNGEAFFDVVHNSKRPFLVHVDGMEVRVLGTSFNIRRNGNQSIIDIATGKVQVSFKREKLILHAGEKISIDPTTTKLVSQKSESLLYNYYVTKKFIANNTRLEDLVNILNKAYNRHIVFARPEIKDMRITTVFSKEPIEVILKVISETLGIRVIYKKDSIELQ